jgi:hypothetical protein
MLTVFANRVKVPGSLDALRVTSAWSEPTVSGSDEPMLGAALATAVPVPGKNGFVAIDVTALVKDWLDGVAPNDGLALVANASAGLFAVLDSKENYCTGVAAPFGCCTGPGTGSCDWDILAQVGDARPRRRPGDRSVHHRGHVAVDPR